MFDFKTIVTAALTSIVVVALSGLVGGNQSDQLGAAWRNPNSDFSAKSLSAYNPSATSTTYIYSGAAGVGGALIVEDTDAAGCSSIAALNGTVVSATVACP